LYNSDTKEDAQHRINEVRKHFIFKTNRQVTRVLDALVPFPVGRTSTKGKGKREEKEVAATETGKTEEDGVLLLKLLKEMNVAEEELDEEQRKEIDEKLAALRYTSRFLLHPSPSFLK